MDRPRPGVADQVAPVAVREPRVPDRRAVLADRVRGQRRVEELHPAVDVAQVVVDPGVDLALHPDRGRLGEPGVLVGVVAHLQDVVVLVGEGHLEDPLLRGAGVLEGVVVVVEDEVAVQPPRQPTGLGLLVAVGRRVAEQLASQVLQVDVGLAVSAPSAAVGERLAPAELAVLDRVDVPGDAQHQLDVVGHAVAVFDPVVVGERRRVEALGDPVDAEAAGAGGRAAAPRGRCRSGAPGRDGRSAAPAERGTPSGLPPTPSPGRATAAASSPIEIERRPRQLDAMPASTPIYRPPRRLPPPEAAILPG